jgi:chemotaxis protein histidine kinase CheA
MARASNPKARASARASATASQATATASQAAAPNQTARERVQTRGEVRRNAERNSNSRARTFQGAAEPERTQTAESNAETTAETTAENTAERCAENTAERCAENTAERCAENTAERCAEPDCESDDEQEEVTKEDWVSEEEDVEFEDPESEDEEDEEEDEDEEAPQGGRRRAPPVPPQFPQNVPPFEPFEHPAQPHDRRVLLPDELWQYIYWATNPNYNHSGPTTGSFCAAECGRGDPERCAGFTSAAEGATSGAWAGGSTGSDRANIAATGEGPKTTWDLPGRFFKLFFDRQVFEMLAENTNAYARARGAGDRIAKRWRETSAAELMVFIGLIIYMGVFRSAQVSQLPLDVVQLV